MSSASPTFGAAQRDEGPGREGGSQSDLSAALTAGATQRAPGSAADVPDGAFGRGAWTPSLWRRIAELSATGGVQTPIHRLS